MPRRFTIPCLVVTGLLFSAQCYAYDDVRVENAINAVKDLCLTGKQFDLKADASGNITFKRLQPGGEGSVSVNVRDSQGNPAIVDDAIRRLADNDIRECIKPYMRPIIDAILGTPSQPSPRSSTKLESVVPRPQRLSNKVKARIVSRTDSNKVTIRLGSCNSTLTRTVDAGLTVTVIRHQFPDCNGFLRIADDAGNVLGWISKDRIELLGPVQE